MESNIRKALIAAKECMPGFEMLKCYDYGDFYYFSCMKDGELRNGPCIDKKTLKRLPMSSAELMLLGDYSKVIDAKEISSKDSSL